MNNKKKAGGLGFNPLLQNTEEIETTSTHADTQTSKQESVPTSTHADTSASTPVHTQTHIPADTQTSKPVATPEGTQANTPTSTLVHTQTRVPADTQKFTFYFTQEQLDRLDQVWTELRQQRRRTGQQRVSKSQLVRVALDKLLDDFERDPEETICLLLKRLE